MPLTYKLLGSIEVGGTTVSTLRVSNIPQGFDNLIISGVSKTTSGSSNIRMIFNDATSLYSERFISGTSVSTSTTNPYITISSGGTSSDFHAFNITIFDYSSSFYKNAFCTWAGPTSSGSANGEWASSSAVTEITFEFNTTEFATGSRINVYGVAGIGSGNSQGGGGTWKRYKLFTETLTTSGTWTLPSGVTSVDVVSVGGGGNGGGGNAGGFCSACCGGSGGSGGTAGAVTFSTVTVSAPVSYTIGGVAGTTTFSSPVSVSAGGAASNVAKGGGGGGGCSGGAPGGTGNFSNLGISGVSVVVGGGGGGGGGGRSYPNYSAGAAGGAGGTGGGPGGGGGNGTWGPPNLVGGGGSGASNRGSAGGGGGGGGAKANPSHVTGGGAGGPGAAGIIYLAYRQEV